MIIFDESITFSEVPSEISYTLFLPCNRVPRCKNCSWLGKEKETYNLTIHQFKRNLDDLKGKVTCVTFLGEGTEENPLRYGGKLSKFAKMARSRGFKTCLYTGRELEDVFFSFRAKLDFLKVGAYKEECGDLYSKTTNQHFYELYNGKIIKEIFFYAR